MSLTRLLLFPGWATTAEALAPLCTALRQLPRPIMAEAIPLPHMDGTHADDWLAQLSARLHESDQRPWLGGWSLGGMLASRLAALAPERFSGVVGLAANARFVASNDWPTALPQAIFADFLRRYQRAPTATLKRFSLLCCQGDTSGQALPQLSNCLQPASAPDQAAQLEWLAQLDNRALLKQLTLPQLHLFARHDALVPSAAGNAFERLSNPQLTSVGLNGSHAFPLSQASHTAQAIAAFIHRHTPTDASRRGPHE